MRTRLEAAALLVAGPTLVAARPPWTSLPEDRLVVAVWAAACLSWLWLAGIGGVHAWATRTGRRRWRRLSGALLPAGVRRRAERLAMAGLLLAPVAACAPGGGGPGAAPVLVLEETIPLAPDRDTTTTPPPAAAPPSTAPTAVAPTTAAPTTVAPTTPTTAAPTTGPATAAPAGPGPSTTAPAGPATTVLDPAGATAAGSPTAAPAAPDEPDPDPDDLFPPVVESGARVVQRGESLWSIAADHVATDLGRRPSPAEVAPYWRRVVAANQATLRSGDPDLIHPGEVIRLPALRS